MNIRIYLHSLRVVWQKQGQVALIKKTIVFLIFFLLMACSYSSKKTCPINDSYGRCMSEAQVYENSLRQEDRSISRKTAVFLPIIIEKIKDKGPGSYEDSLFHRTWVFRHTDQNKIVIDGHYVYWDSRLDPIYSNSVIRKEILHPY